MIIICKPTKTNNTSKKGTLTNSRKAFIKATPVFKNIKWLIHKIGYYAIDDYVKE